MSTGQVYSQDITEQYFLELDSLVDAKDKVRMDESSEQLLRYMGFTDKPMDDLGANNVYDPPSFDKVPAELKLTTLRDMIPADKGNLKEMYPLLSGIIPKLVDCKENDVTRKMKRELRAENLILLIKEIFANCVEQLERVRDHQNKVQQNQKRLSKAMSTLGIDDLTPRQSQNPKGSSKSTKTSPTSAGSRMHSATGPDPVLTKSFSASSLDQVDEGQASGGSPRKDDSPVTKATNNATYRMRFTRANDEGLGNNSERIVLMVDDMQWIDPTSIRLLEQIAKEISPTLLILSTRNMSDFSFEMESVRHLHLGNLSREEVREGMCKWLNVKEIPDKALTAVMEKSGGHPLFSAELARLMETEQMIVIEGDTCKLSKKAQEGNFGLPDTISALMTSKLDRLPPSQQLMLKVAAVIGTEFQKHELIALMPRTDNDGREVEDEHKTLSDDIGSLVELGLLSRDPSMFYHYRFTNAMLRESAYNLLLFQKRKDLHRKLAEFHEERNKEYLDPVYFLLASNYFLAEVNDKAVYYSEKAGNDALDVHGMQQVLICFSRLLHLDATDPETTKHIPLYRKVGWSRKVGEALLHLGKPADAEDYFHAALEQIDLRSRTLTLEPAGCLSFLKGKRPLPLVRKLPAYEEMVQSKDCELLLEAANTFELLGKINNDRDSPDAMAYRLNALDLAIAADRILSNIDAGSESTRELARAELARSYAYVAVFFVCTGQPGFEESARDNIRKASVLVESVQDSETQALVHFKVSEFSAMMGELKQASDGVRKALWVSQFLNYEKMQLECTELSVCVFTFLGSLGRAKKMLHNVVAAMPVSSPNYLILALFARASLFVGDFGCAEMALERIGRFEAGTFEKNFDACVTKLLKSEMPETLLALALLLVRKYEKRDLATAAAIRGTELLHSTNLNDLPLASFHTAAFLLTAFAECLAGVPLKRKRNQARKTHRLSFSQIAPYDESSITPSSRQIRRNARKHLKQVVSLLWRYAQVYRPCKAHYTYCVGLHRKILNGKTDVKTFLAAAELAETAQTRYIRALGLFEAGLADPAYLNNAKHAFRDCMEPRSKPEGKGSLGSDAPYELKLLEEEDLL